MRLKIMLAGNMGEEAVKLLNNSGIEVLRRYYGDVKTVAQNWINGAVVDSGDLCHEHGCHK